MLYQLAKLLAVRSIKFFYNRVIVTNIENIPDEGPVIFTANHPNTMLDPMLIGYAAPRKLYFIAKSTLFIHPLFSWFLNHLNIIPVYRRQDVPDEMDKNEDTFNKCYELLETNGSILIFPEGISTAQRTLSKIKTGSTRIAMGAEVRNDFKLGVKIIPVGINYSDSVKFRSDVYIRFGQPINIADYSENYQEDEVETVHLVTQRIELALQKLTVTVKELDMEDIVAGLERIYKKELITDLGMKTKDKNDEFAVTRGMIQAVEWFYEQQPERVENFKKLLERYLSNLDRLDLDDDFLSPTADRGAFIKRVGALVFLLLGFPVYVFGLINNYLPYQFPRWYTRRYISDQEWYATAKLATGAIVFISYYGLLATLFWQLTGSLLLTIIYIVLLIPSGNFVMWYMEKFQSYRQHLRFINIFYHKRNLIYRVIEQRIQLIHFLNDAKQDYMKNMELFKDK